jgi:hypothetical protein
MKVPENLKGWKLKETHQLLVYAGDTDLFSKNINSIKNINLGNGHKSSIRHL